MDTDQQQKNIDAAKAAQENEERKNMMVTLGKKPSKNN